MKYKLTNESIKINDHILYRIECVTPFENIEIGDKGGFIEKEGNLSQTDNAWVYNNAKVYGNACVSDDAKVYGNSIIYDNAGIYDNAVICSNAVVCDHAKVGGTAGISGNAKVCGDAEVYGYAIICRDAIVSNKESYIVFKNWWSSGRYFTWTRSNNMWKVGCFYGTGEELIAKAYKDSEKSGKEYERIVKYVESIQKDYNEKTTPTNQEDYDPAG